MFMPRQRLPAFILFLLLILSLASCSTETIQNNGDWTIPDDDPASCDQGDPTVVFVSRVEITPVGDATTTLWSSYNGSHCDEFQGASAEGTLVQWFQIVENTYGEMLIRVYDEDMQETGWVYCSEVTFLHTLDEYADVLPMNKYDLLEACFLLSGGGQ